jgi:hypothetical protein
MHRANVSVNNQVVRNVAVRRQRKARRRIRFTGATTTTTGTTIASHWLQHTASERADDGQLLPATAFATVGAAPRYRGIRLWAAAQVRSVDLARPLPFAVLRPGAEPDERSELSA